MYFVHSSFAIILIGKRELVVLHSLYSWSLVIGVHLFLVSPWACLQFLIVVFPNYTHLLLLGFLCQKYWSIKKVISLRNISKGFFTFSLYINSLCFTIHVIKFSCHFISINHQTTFEYKYKIHSCENTKTCFQYIPIKHNRKLVCLYSKGSISLHLPLL